MDLKTYLQNKAESKTEFKAENFRTVTALMPKPITVGEELKVVDFKCETVSQLFIVCAREDQEIREIKYTWLVREADNITPDNVECVASVKEKHGDKLCFIYTLAKYMTVEILVDLLKDKTIVLCGQTEAPITIRGKQVKLHVNKFAYIDN